LKPKGVWNGNLDFKFTIKGHLDVTYASNLENRHSVTGYSVFLEEAPVTMKSGGQTSVTLSSAESELASGRQCGVQDMWLYTIHIMED
jgi:hypothetical protein